MDVELVEEFGQVQQPVLRLLGVQPCVQRDQPAHLLANGHLLPRTDDYAWMRAIGGEQRHMQPGEVADVGGVEDAGLASGERELLIIRLPYHPGIQRCNDIQAAQPGSIDHVRVQRVLIKVEAKAGQSARGLFAAGSLNPVGLRLGGNLGVDPLAVGEVVGDAGVDARKVKERVAPQDFVGPGAFAVEDTQLLDRKPGPGQARPPAVHTRCSLNERLDRHFPCGNHRRSVYQSRLGRGPVVVKADPSPAELGYGR